MGPVPFVDGEVAAMGFRQRVFSLLPAAGLLCWERTRLLLSWWYSGLSVPTLVTVARDGRDDLERLAH